MNQIILLLLICISWNPTEAGKPDRTAEMVLVPVGDSIAISLLGVGTIHVSDGKALRVRNLNNSLRLFGLKPGTVRLSYGTRSMMVNVVTPQAYRAWPLIRDHLKDTRGLKVDVEDGEVRVQGEVLRCEDWTELGEKVAKAGGEFNMEARILPQVKKCIVHYLAKLIADASLPPLSLEVEPKAVAHLPTMEKDRSDAYSRVLKPFGFSIQSTTAALYLEPMIEVELQITELRKTSFRKLGLDLPTTYRAAVLPASLGGGESAPRNGAGSDMSIYLHALEQSGDLKVLASPRLVCRSGKEAQFLAGGEFPIKIINFQINDVVWKRYGVMLNVKPRADLAGRMSIELQTEISAVDDSLTVDGLPGILTNRVSSHFDLSESHTIALSGLIKNEEGRSQSGLAFLQKLPILGSLFGSEQFKSNRTDLVIFVTPRVISQEDSKTISPSRKTDDDG